MNYSVNDVNVLSLLPVIVYLYNDCYQYDDNINIIRFYIWHNIVCDKEEWCDHKYIHIYLKDVGVKSFHGKKNQIKTHGI